MPPRRCRPRVILGFVLAVVLSSHMGLGRANPLNPTSAKALDYLKEGVRSRNGGRFSGIDSLGVKERAEIAEIEAAALPLSGLVFMAEETRKLAGSVFEATR